MIDSAGSLGKCTGVQVKLKSTRYLAEIEAKPKQDK